MKCKKCGGQYKTRELKCPYCDTENFLGKLWSIQRSEEEKSYENKKSIIKKYLASPFMLNRIANRCLVVWIIFSVILFLGAFLFFWTQEEIEKLKFRWNQNEIEAQMKEYYDAEEYALLDVYMKENVIDETQYYAYTQAVLLNDYYQRYMEYRLKYDNLSEEEKQEDDYYLDSAVRYSVNVYNFECGYYRELDESNRMLYENYQKEIMAYWVGELLLNSKEIEDLLERGHLE